MDTTKREDQKKKEEQLARREVNDYKAILAMPEGRRVLWGLLSTSGIFRSSFTGNSTTFFNEGARDQGLVLLKKIIAAKPSAYNQMMLENYSEIQSYKKKEGEL
jgi:hypothetical protein